MGQGVDEALPREVGVLEAEDGRLTEVETALGANLSAKELALEADKATSISLRASNFARGIAEKLEGMALAFFRSLKLDEIFDFDYTQRRGDTMRLHLTFNRKEGISGDLCAAIDQAGCKLTGTENVRCLEIPLEKLDCVNSDGEVDSEIVAVRRLVKQIVELSPERIVRPPELNIGC